MTIPAIANQEAVAAALAPTTVPMRVGAKHLSANERSPRYVWVWSSIDPEPASGAGGNPRREFTDAWNAEVHCWGRTLEEAARLRQALVTALRTTLGGPGNVLVGRTEILASDKEYRADGDVLVVRLTMRTPLNEARIENPIVDKTRRTTRARYAAIDPARVVAIGTAPPPVTVLGEAVGRPVVVVDIETAGARAEALFRWSKDGGMTWVEQGVATAPAYALGATGLTVQFPLGAYSVDNTYTFTQRSPVPGDGQLDALEE